MCESGGHHDSSAGWTEFSVHDCGVVGGVVGVRA